MIHPAKFGVAVAEASGLVGDGFTSEEAAVAWLQRLHANGEDRTAGGGAVMGGSRHVFRSDRP